MKNRVQNDLKEKYEKCVTYCQILSVQPRAIRDMLTRDEIEKARKNKKDGTKRIIQDTSPPTINVIEEVGEREQFNEMRGNFTSDLMTLVEIDDSMDFAFFRILVL